MTTPSNSHLITLPENLPKAVLAVEAATVTQVVALVQQAIGLGQPTTPEQAEQARGILVQIQKLKNQVEKDRKATQAPFKDITDRIMEVAKTVVSPLERAQHVLKTGLEHYIVEEQKAAAARQAEIIKAQAAPIPEGRQTPALPVMVPAQRVAAVATYTHTEVVIDNPDLVPREFCSPDMVKIRAHLQMGGKIPGISVVSSPRIAAR